MVPEPAPAAGDVRIVFVTAPPDAATDLARALVDERLAACVNLVPGLRSIYRWKDALQDDPETLLVIKASATGVAALTERVVALHPYETPEVLAIAPQEGLADYLAWVVDSTSG